MKFDDFVYVNKNALNKDLCEHIIIKFEEDERK